MQQLTIGGAVRHKTRGVGILKRIMGKDAIVDFPKAPGVTRSVDSLTPVFGPVEYRYTVIKRACVDFEQYNVIDQFNQRSHVIVLPLPDGAEIWQQDGGYIRVERDGLVIGPDCRFALEALRRARPNLVLRFDESPSAAERLAA